MPHCTLMRRCFGYLEFDLCQYAFVVCHCCAWPCCTVRHVCEHQVKSVLPAIWFFDNLSKTQLVRDVAQQSTFDTFSRRVCEPSYRMNVQIAQHKTPAASSLCFRYSTSKLLMVSTLPGLDGLYQQHIRYGPRSE